jgi:hypothetical protein
MAITLELPSGDTVDTEEVFLFEGYPYRVLPADAAGGIAAEDDSVTLVLRPLYWGGGDMDVPLRGREELVDRWGPDSKGTMTGEEWAAWLESARSDDRFGDEELDALARELLPGGPLVRLRRALGL